ncbi:hypothetical protein R1sor_011499 [Riccia sorocarpa]|uniref:Uncharacterized protein n=1 Tax=Riccia sorocarpa TaxID=122646 RepID=A0ABD3I125_9MARC
MSEDDGHVIEPLPHPLSHVVTHLPDVEPPTAAMSAPTVGNTDARLATASGKDSSPDDPEYNYGLKQAELSASLTSLNIQIDEHGSFDPLVTEPMVNNYKVFPVRPKEDRLLRAHTTATVQGQRGKNPPTDPRKKPIAKGAKTLQQITGAPGPKAQAIKTRQTSSKNPK